MSDRQPPTRRAVTHPDIELAKSVGHGNLGSKWEGTVTEGTRHLRLKGLPNPLSPARGRWPVPGGDDLSDELRNGWIAILGHR